MEINYPNRGKVNSLIILLYGLLLLPAALFIFLFILKNVHSRYSSTIIIPSEEILKIFESSKKYNAGLLNSNCTENISAAGNKRKSNDSIANKKLIVHTKI